MKDKEWLEMTDEEQEKFYEEHNIGGGFREVGFGGIKILKEEDLPEEALKRLRKIKEQEHSK